MGCAVWWRCCCCCGFPPTAPTHPHLQDLGNERAAADADLRERLGTLRYLLGLQEREASKAAAAAAAAAAAEAAEAMLEYEALKKRWGRARRRDEGGGGRICCAGPTQVPLSLVCHLFCP